MIENLKNIKNNIATNTVQRSIKPYFEKENFLLYHENCLEIMQRLPDNVVDLIFADPPYLLSNDGVTCHAGKMVKVNKGDWDKSRGFETAAGCSLRDCFRQSL